MWMAPALQEFSAIATVRQYSRVFGLFAQRSDVLLALMGSTDQVPIGSSNLGEFQSFGGVS